MVIRSGPFPIKVTMRDFFAMMKTDSGRRSEGFRWWPLNAARIEGNLEVTNFPLDNGGFPGHLIFGDFWGGETPLHRAVSILLI